MSKKKEVIPFKAKIFASHNNVSEPESYNRHYLDTSCVVLARSLQEAISKMLVMDLDEKYPIAEGRKYDEGSFRVISITEFSGYMKVIE